MKAAIFDFDGTIADSCYVWDKVDRMFFEKRGMSIPIDYTRKISTLNLHDGAVFTKNEYGFSDSVEEIKSEWLSGALDEYRDKVILKPFAAEYIRSLKSKGVRLALATAASPDFYTPVLVKSGIYELFDVFADGHSGLPGKHEPDMFLHCAEMLQREPKDCTVFEDILPAIVSANKIGMNTVGIFEQKSRNDWDKIKKAATRSILSFSELL